ncbi:hypothetical protein AB0K18_10620 [Nonomuraea sp. NPDC049421]|uniref:hypothetical protein n=1 Tax=Nonomuraea sp. NPDC049421 TaxID=3155275 RepID=UPI00342A1535
MAALHPRLVEFPAFGSRAGRRSSTIWISTGRITGRFLDRESDARVEARNGVIVVGDAAVTDEEFSGGAFDQVSQGWVSRLPR